ncbi:MAG: hypothetical protein ABI939_12370 [Anaerolineaceae bacterium]
MDTDRAIGAEATITARVGAGDSADAYGNDGLEVLATPALVGLFERAAMQAVAGLLDATERTVGSVVEMAHEAPTAVGAEVMVTARVEAVEGARVWFVVRAEDAAGQVASGRHARFVVDDARFRGRAAKRLEGGGSPGG